MKKLKSSFKGGSTIKKNITDTISETVNKTEEKNNTVVKNITKVVKTITPKDVNTLEELISNEKNSRTHTTEEPKFKLCTNTLPAKVSIWTKIRNVLFYEIKVELTPHQQKVEDEINEFLHQEITWEKFSNFISKIFRYGKNKKD